MTESKKHLGNRLSLFTFASVSNLKHLSGQEHDTVVGEGIGEPNEPEYQCRSTVLFGQEINELASLHVALEADVIDLGQVWINQDVQVRDSL